MNRRVNHDAVLEVKKELAQIEADLVGLQRSFVTKLDELHQIKSLEKHLTEYGLESGDVQSWASVCRKLNCRTRGNHHHFAIKRSNPSLHIFLHKFVFSNACSLDQVSYS
jgi:hypothetical protein